MKCRNPLMCPPKTRFPTIVKPAAFYDYHADPNGSRRSYFYNIDLQGRLFLEDTLPKNVATSIKDERFLNFFFARIRRNTTNDDDSEWPIDPQDYPFVSVCTKYETNYIRPAACPIVFHSLQHTTEEDAASSMLQHAGTLTTPFSPHALAVSSTSGRLYHGLEDRHRGTQYYGLIRSSVAVQLSERLDVNEEDGRWVYSTPARTSDTDGDHNVLLPWLPIEHEPGPWGMPISS